MGLMEKLKERELHAEGGEYLLVDRGIRGMGKCTSAARK